ncbi:hypothetical protein CFP56_030017 [Quercus suber]|uniref:Uncharacterized protein n=1 Tax=Quercus suber TaxID=58331 RepID=A0AAW0JNN5_QUESU
MELVQELLVTASLTLILSLVVAKLVSMAMSVGSDHDSQVKSTPNAQEIVMEDIQFSTVQSFQSETKLHESLEEQYNYNPNTNTTPLRDFKSSTT